jgi:hypothetical protein
MKLMTHHRRQIALHSGWDGIGLIFETDEAGLIRPRDISLQLYNQAYMWFRKLAIFRVGESCFMYHSKPKEEILRDHKLILGKLTQEAKEILRKIRVNGEMIKPENGFTMEDLEAAVEELENTRLQWHGGMHKGRKNEILARVFNVQES